MRAAHGLKRHTATQRSHTEVLFMKRFIKAFTGAFCAVTILLTGVSVFAADDRKTPSGTDFGDIGGVIEKWAKDNKDGYVSFVTAVFNKDELLFIQEMNLFG